MPGRARMGQVRRQPCAEEMQWVGWFPKQHPHDAGGGMQAGSWSWWGGGQDTLGTHGVVLASSGRGISGPCRVRMGARWVLAEGAGCSSAAASLLVSGEGSLPRGWMLQGGGKHPAKSQPLSQHTENCSFYRKLKEESSNTAHQQAHRAAEVPLAAAGWDALALHCHPQPCKPSEQDSPCSYPGNLFAQLQSKK